MPDIEENDVEAAIEWVRKLIEDGGELGWYETEGLMGLFSDPEKRFELESKLYEMREELGIEYD